MLARALPVIVSSRLPSAEAAEQLRLEEKPAAIAAQRAQIIDLVTAAEAERRAHADALVYAESRTRDAERTLKTEEAALMAERETRVRAEAQTEQAVAHLAEVTARIRERLDCAPEETLATGGVDADDELPSVEQIEARVERLTRERDNVGPVNLRAEQEAEELGRTGMGVSIGSRPANSIASSLI